MTVTFGPDSYFRISGMRKLHMTWRLLAGLRHTVIVGSEVSQIKVTYSTLTFHLDS